MVDMKSFNHIIHNILQELLKILFTILSDYFFNKDQILLKNRFFKFLFCKDMHLFRVLSIIHFYCTILKKNIFFSQSSNAIILFLAEVFNNSNASPYKNSFHILFNSRFSWEEINWRNQCETQDQQVCIKL